MKTACSRARSVLAQGVHDGLDESARASALEHARRCAECADAVGFEIELMGQIERTPLEPLPDHYFQGVLEEIHRRMPPRVPAARGRRRRWAPSRETVATAACMGLGLMWWAMSRTPAPGPDQDFSPRISREVAAAVDARGSALAARGGSKDAPRFVIAQGIGIIPADAPLLQLPAETLAEFGIREIRALGSVF